MISVIRNEPLLFLYVHVNGLTSVGTMQPVESKMEYAVLVVVPQHEPVPGVPTRAAVRFTRQSKAGKDATVAVALRGAFMVCTVSARQRASQLLVIYVLASQPFVPDPFQAFTTVCFLLQPSVDGIVLLTRRGLQFILLIILSHVKFKL